MESKEFENLIKQVEALNIEEQKNQTFKESLTDVSMITAS